MSGAPISIVALLADCNARGIQLLPADDGGLTIDTPQDALAPELLARLKTHKAALLMMQQTTPEAPAAQSTTPADAPATPTKPVCRCGSVTWRDVSIHNGQSVRRDCAQCRRFIDFPVWNPAKP